MRKLLVVAVVLGAFCLAVGTVRAVSLTLDFTQAQVDIVQWKYAQAGSPGPNVQTWFAGAVDRLISEWGNQKTVADAGSFCTAFKSANTTVQNQICSGLGLASGCVPCR